VIGKRALAVSCCQTLKGIIHDMRCRLLVLLHLILLNSCATIMNDRHTTTTLYTNSPTKVVVNQDTFSTVNNQLPLSLLRGKKPVSILIITDSAEKVHSINSKNSFAYYGNIICNYGVGMFIDRNNPKRYTYPRRVYLNVSDTLNEFLTVERSHKGKVFLHLSLPHVNSFLLSPENESARTNTGFWGISIGLHYFHQNNQFLNVSVSGVADFFVAIPAAVDISGEYGLMSSRYLSFSNNHNIKRFSFGYGFSYAKNTWDLRYYDRFNPPPPSRDPVKKSNDALGLVFSSYYQAGKSFNLGVIYRPTVYRLDAQPSFQYEHLLSLDFGWRIPLTR
jgi:hypothetical protein